MKKTPPPNKLDPRLVKQAKALFEILHPNDSPAVKHRTDAYDLVGRISIEGSWTGDRYIASRRTDPNKALLLLVNRLRTLVKRELARQDTRTVNAMNTGALHWKQVNDLRWDVQTTRISDGWDAERC